MNRIKFTIAIVLGTNIGTIAFNAPLVAQTVGQSITCNGQKYKADITWYDTTPRLTIDSKPSGKKYLKNAPARRISYANGSISYIAGGETTTTVTFNTDGKCSLQVKSAKGEITVQDKGQTQTSTANNQNLQTVLAFQTDSYKVRVFRRNGQLYMNLYDKQKGFLVLDEIPVKEAPKQRDNDHWTVYIYQEPEFVQQGQVIQIAYIARLNDNGQLELEIIKDGAKFLVEAGY